MNNLYLIPHSNDSRHETKTLLEGIHLYTQAKKYEDSIHS